MTPPDTFTDLARRLAREGAGAACDAEAARLMSLATAVPRQRARLLRRAALGLAMAARRLASLAGAAGGRIAPFRPIGLRGAVAAGSAALAAGRLKQAELIGLAAAEAAPDCAAGLRLAGQALFAQERYGAAVRALGEAVAHDPLDAFGRALHAEALLFAGERAEAWRALSSLRAHGEAAAPLAWALERALRAGALRGAGQRRQAGGAP